jgi:hypothetical protein
MGGSARPAPKETTHVRAPPDETLAVVASAIDCADLPDEVDYQRVFQH